MRLTALCLCLSCAGSLEMSPDSKQAYVGTEISAQTLTFLNNKYGYAIDYCVMISESELDINYCGKEINHYFCEHIVKDSDLAYLTNLKYHNGVKIIIKAQLMREQCSQGRIGQ